MSSCASPPKPAMPSEFVTEPAASAETKVPWPSLSATAVRWWTTSQVSGDLAARSGCVTSAPVSTMAIVIALAARNTSAGTSFSRVATYCHSYGSPGRRAVARAGSTFVVRSRGVCEYAMPGRPSRSPARPGSSTSTVFMCGRRLTIFAPGKRLSARASSGFE